MKNLSTSVLLSQAGKTKLTAISTASKETGPTPHVSKSHSRRAHDLKNRGYADIAGNDVASAISIHHVHAASGSNSSLSSSSMSTRPLRSGKEPVVDSKNRRSDYRQVSLFGIDLSPFPATCQASLLIVIILFGFISIGYVEEGFKFEFGDFSYGWFMTAVELLIFSAFAMVERLFKSLSQITNAVYLSSASTVNLNLPSSAASASGTAEQEQLESECVSLIKEGGTGNEEAASVLPDDHSKLKSNDVAMAMGSNTSKICLLFKLNYMAVIFEKQMPLKYHLMVAVAMMCSRALTNIALLLLNYPTQVIFKSMKLISVMVGSVCCLKKEYHKCEYIGAPVLVMSAICFTLGDANDLNFNMLGIVVVLISLIFDAIHANSQQYILQAKTERDTTMELLVYSNLFAGGLALVVSLLVGELTDIYTLYIPQQPAGTVYKLFIWFLIRVACLYIGVSAFVVFTKRFGAVFAVTITTVRKIMTVLLSYVFYPGKKTFLPLQHGTGTVCFVLSLIFWGMGTVYKKQGNAHRPGK